MRRMLGEPPSLHEARRNLDCLVDNKRLIVFGKEFSVHLTTYCLLQASLHEARRNLAFIIDDAILFLFLLSPYR